jgi:hypothetical protein
VVTIARGGGLDSGGGNQGGAENGKCLSHGCFSRDGGSGCEKMSRVFAVAGDMATRLPNISGAGFTIGSVAIKLGRANFLASAKYSAIAPVAPVDLPPPIRFNGPNRVFRRQRCRNICWSFS